MEPVKQCQVCARLRERWTCEAFPAGIPHAILMGEHVHTEAFKGDGGLRFTPTERLRALRVKYGDND